MDSHEGGCHCGAVRFRVAVQRYEALQCNCSMCTKKANLHLVVRRDQFTLLRGAEALTTYRFNTGVAQHTFGGDLPANVAIRVSVGVASLPANGADVEALIRCGLATLSEALQRGGNRIAWVVSGDRDRRQSHVAHGAGEGPWVIEGPRKRDRQALWHLLEDVGGK